MNTCCISGEEKVYSRSNSIVISVFLLSSSFETHESNILDHTLEDARCSGKSDVETQLLAMLSAKIVCILAWLWFGLNFISTEGA